VQVVSTQINAETGQSTDYATWAQNSVLLDLGDARTRWRSCSGRGPARTRRCLSRVQVVSTQINAGTGQSTNYATWAQDSVPLDLGEDSAPLELGAA
jgi:hypothetical protein